MRLNGHPVDTHEAAKLCAYLRRLVIAAKCACAVMANGFIAPEEQSEEFQRGWDSACKEFAESRSRQMLADLLDEAAEWIATDPAATKETMGA